MNNLYWRATRKWFPCIITNQVYQTQGSLPIQTHHLPTPHYADFALHLTSWTLTKDKKQPRTVQKLTSWVALMYENGVHTAKTRVLKDTMCVFTYIYCTMGVFTYVYCTMGVFTLYTTPKIRTSNNNNNLLVLYCALSRASLCSRAHNSTNCKILRKSTPR